MDKTILIANKSYTFSDFFNLANSIHEIVAEFGYQFHLQKLDLPKAQLPEGALTELQNNFYRKLPHISLNSEMAKREFFVSPLLFALLDHADFHIDVEYPLYVNDYLRGTIDYFIQSTQNLIVIEAKNADLERGFTQLAVELIAVDQHLAHDNPILYGAITVGDIWRFGILTRQTKVILRDIDAFVVPTDLHSLFSILVGILGASKQGVSTD